MRATILPPPYRAVVSVMAEGSIVACVLSLRCFLFLLSNYVHANAIKVQRKYCNKNTPNPQYSTLLTSSG